MNGQIKCGRSMRFLNLVVKGRNISPRQSTDSYTKKWRWRFARALVLVFWWLLSSFPKRGNKFIRIRNSELCPSTKDLLRPEESTMFYSAGNAGLLRVGLINSTKHWGRHNLRVAQYGRREVHRFIQPHPPFRNILLFEHYHHDPKEPRRRADERIRV